MSYPLVNGTLVGQNLGELFIYANSVTHNFFALFITVGFFLVTFLGSLFMQLRFRAVIKPETSLLASSFATLGFAIILEMYSGILNPVYFIFIVGVLILSIIWNVISE